MSTKNSVKAIGLWFVVSRHYPTHYWPIISQGVYSLIGKTPYRQISRSFEPARLNVIVIVSLWNLASISAAVLLRCLSNFRAIWKGQTRISRLRVFARSCDKTSYRLVKSGSAAMSHGIYRRALLSNLKIPISKTRLKIAFLKSYPDLPGNKRFDIWPPHFLFTRCTQRTSINCASRGTKITHRAVRTSVLIRKPLITELDYSTNFI